MKNNEFKYTFTWSEFKRNREQIKYLLGFTSLERNQNAGRESIHSQGSSDNFGLSRNAHAQVDRRG